MSEDLYTAFYDPCDGLYLEVQEDKNEKFLESLENCKKESTDLKGFFNRKLDIVGKLKGMTVFFIGITEDLFGKKYFYEPILILSENRIFCKHGEHHGRDYNFIKNEWR